MYLTVYVIDQFNRAERIDNHSVVDLSITKRVVLQFPLLAPVSLGICKTSQDFRQKGISVASVTAHFICDI